MEYLEGMTLLPVLRQSSRDGTPLELGFVAAVLQQTCDALHYAHELKDRDGSTLGIVHRDITPSNLFVTDAGVLKVLDFGIAKAKGASASHTQTGAVKGKYAYMAPEQLRGGEIDRRADVFALGIALFEMLGLRRLFQRKTDYLTFRAVMEQPMPDIRAYRPDTPDALAAVVMRALDRDASARFDTARQLSAAVLDAIAADGRRPWSQGEVGDFIRNAFADDLVKRTDQVANATHRTQPGTPRALFAPTDIPETAPDDFDEDTEFLPVDTAADTPPPGTLSAPPPPQDTTPTPFGHDSTTSGDSLQPVVHDRLPGAAPPRRNLLWPIVAVGMFVVAGGALALVWKMTTQVPPAQVTISTPGTTQVGSDDHIVVSPPPPPQRGSAQVATGSAAGSAAPLLPTGSIRNRVSPPAPASSAAKAYDVVITAHSVALSRCAKDHPGDAPPSSAQVRIAPSGRPVAVTLEPAALNTTELGGCLKSVLQALQFPTAAMEVQVTFPFHVKST